MSTAAAGAGAPAAPATAPERAPEGAPKRAPKREAALEQLRAALGELFAAERRLRGRDHQQRGQGQLSYAQVRALFLLCDEQQGVTAGQLAKMAELTPASVTALLDHVEREGFVERQRSDEDRRVVVISLTERGRELLNAKRQRWIDGWRGVLEDLPEQDLAAAARVMKRLGGMYDRF